MESLATAVNNELDHWRPNLNLVILMLQQMEIVD